MITREQERFIFKFSELFDLSLYLLDLLKPREMEVNYYQQNGHLMEKGSYRSDGSKRKDRRINENWRDRNSEEIKSKYVIPALRDESYGKKKLLSFIHDELKQDCTCNRELKFIFCTICANFSVGRIFQFCSVHPTMEMEKDWKFCNDCQVEKSYLRSIDLPKNFVLFPNFFRNM